MSRPKAIIAAGACLAAITGGATQLALASSQPSPTVLAAASLSKVFPRIDPSGHYTFGGSNALATDIEQGAPADVFASASPKETSALYAQGLVNRPREFATNRLVLIVPASNPMHINSVYDVTKRGVRLVICQAAVPCGDYSRNVFANLGITKAALKHVVSQTTDVTQVLTDVSLGQADAGFVYYTDARSAGSKVRIISLPAKAKPNATDWIAVVRSAPDPQAARAFFNEVLSSSGQSKLRAAGFGKP
jgi:molybdate transport system substrate-binding protein